MKRGIQQQQLYRLRSVGSSIRELANLGKQKRNSNETLPLPSFGQISLILAHPSLSCRQEAKVPFMIADVVIVVAMKYVERGIAAENKLRHLEEQHAEQNREMDKGEKLAQKRATRQQNHKLSTQSSHKSGSRNTKINNIQQPSKRD